jgi:hypothetical protein
LLLQQRLELEQRENKDQLKTLFDDFQKANTTKHSFTQIEMFADSITKIAMLINIIPRME